MKYLIGVDSGTTNMKALLFDELGNTVAQAKHPSPAVLLDNGGGIFESEKVWQIASSLIHDVVDRFTKNGGDRADIAGIAITGMGEAGVPMDEEGNPLYPIIAWFDPRTEQYLSWWRETFGEERMQEITNLKNQHIFTVNKLVWLKEHEPEVFARMKHWNCVPDYIAYKLSGESAMDYSIGTRTMMMDVANKCWSKEILEHAGISEEILPKLVPSGTKVGGVTKEAEEICGLLEGTPVFAGGHDHICGALAAGVVEPGVVLDSSGTCEEVLVSTYSLDEAKKLGMEGFNAGFHVAGNSYYVASGIPASGASVDWFKREFPSVEGSEYQSCAGANGLLFLPHIRGSSSPDRDKVSKGSFIGVQAQHHWEDFMQAVYEGVAFELRLSAERVSGGKPIERIVSIGGATLNAQWLQIKADVLGTEIEVPEVQESTAFGAAILAGIGAGVYESQEDAIRKTCRIGKVVQPRKETKETYDRMYEIFKCIYPTIYDLNKSLEKK